MKIGFHVSTSKGFSNAIEESIKYNGNIFQFFPRNPRGAKAREIKDEEILLFEENRSKNNFDEIVCHGSYTMNLASSKEHVRKNSEELMIDDFNRISRLGINNYVFHPGSHVGNGEELGIKYIIESLNKILDNSYNFNLCLETMSGKGTELGYTFEQLKLIMDNVDYKNIGICFDTCHVFSAGYNIKDNFDNTIEKLDSIIGLDKVKVIHLNDSKTEFSSKKDRHEKIGQGSLGIATFEKVVNFIGFKDLPMILETPNTFEEYAEEINLLNSLRR